MFLVIRHLFVLQAKMLVVQTWFVHMSYVRVWSSLTFNQGVRIIPLIQSHITTALLGTVHKLCQRPRGGGGLENADNH